MEGFRIIAHNRLKVTEKFCLMNVVRKLSIDKKPIVHSILVIVLSSQFIVVKKRNEVLDLINPITMKKESK